MTRAGWAGWGAALLAVTRTAAADVVPPGWSPPARDAAALETCLPPYEVSTGPWGLQTEIRRTWKILVEGCVVSAAPEDEAVQHQKCWMSFPVQRCFVDVGRPPATVSVALLVELTGPRIATVKKSRAFSSDPRIDARCIDEVLEGSTWPGRVTVPVVHLTVELSFRVSCRESRTEIPPPEPYSPLPPGSGFGGGGVGEGISLGPIGTLSTAKRTNPRKKPRRPQAGEPARRK